MNETTPPPDRVTLLSANGTYYFQEGEAHIDAVLSGGDYPRPVRCISFGSAFELHDYLRGKVALDALWRLHPAIVDRLRADDELEDVTATTS